MKNGVKILLFMVILALGCSGESEQFDSVDLGIVSFSFHETPQIRQVLNRVELESWKLRFESDSLYLTIYKPEKDTNEVKLKEKKSASLYDMYLSTSIIERDKYLIKKISADGVDGRIVSRKYTDSTNYIELYFEDTCPNNYQVLIHGSNLSERTYKMAKQLYKNMSFKCIRN